MFFATVDDVSSAVIDLGTFETRAGKSSKSFHSAFNIRIQLNLRCAGYSGEDCPRSVIPSSLGVLEGEHAKMPQKPAAQVEEDAEMAEEKEVKEQPQIRLITGKSEIGFKRDHMRIEPLYSQEGQSKFFFRTNQ